MKKLVFVILVYILGCENSFTPEYSLAFEPPVVESLPIFNFQEIPIEFSVWNYSGPVTTMDFSEIKDLYVNYNPIYRNPEIGPDRRTTHISFAVQESGKVTLSVMPARAPNEPVQKVVQRFSGSPFFKLNNGGLKLLDESLERGVYSIPFDPVGLGLPSGFYVYILETNGAILQREMYFALTCAEAIPELREYISDCWE